MTSTELGYLSGVTSNIQTQLDGKALSSHKHYGQVITPTFINLNQSDTNTGVVFVETLENEKRILDIITADGIRVWNRDQSMLWIDTNPNYKATWVYLLKLIENNYGTSLPSAGATEGHIFFLKSS